MYNHLPHLDEVLANVELTKNGVNNCIDSFTQILNNVLLPHCCKEFVVNKASTYVLIVNVINL